MEKPSPPEHFKMFVSVTVAKMHPHLFRQKRQMAIDESTIAKCVGCPKFDGGAILTDPSNLHKYMVRSGKMLQKMRRENMVDSRVFKGISVAREIENVIHAGQVDIIQPDETFPFCPPAA